MIRFFFLALLGAVWAFPLQAHETISHGLFRNVLLYRPQNEVRQFVLLLSGDRGWTPGMERLAQALNTEGTMVAGIDLPRLYADMAKADDRCTSLPVGDLENLSHFLQGYARLPTYFVPWLVGYGEGGSLAYAVLANAPERIFSGAISAGFCPYLNLGERLCTGNAPPAGAGSDSNVLAPVSLHTPWLVLQGRQDSARCTTPSVHDFVHQVHGGAMAIIPGVGGESLGETTDRRWIAPLIRGYRVLASRDTSSLPAPPGSLSGLPLIEVPSADAGDILAIMLSGDGGWAGLDKEVASALAAKGIPVVGFDSLRYFWSRRTPDELASDLDRVLRFYSVHWNKPNVVLIGYSQGADVLPFAVNRLPDASRRHIAQTILIGLGEKASFEFHVTNWAGGEDRESLPIAPEMLRLSNRDTLCLYGDGDGDSSCPRVSPRNTDIQALPGGHHFDGAYGDLVDIIVKRSQMK